MMKTIQYFILIFVVASMSACDDFLEIRPKGKIIPEKIEDYDLMFNDDSYIKLLGADIFQGNDNFYASESDLDAYGNFKKQCYLWGKEIYDEGSVIYADWNTLYANVYQTNLIIDGVQKLGDNSENKKVIAAAKAKRALQYYFLINLYAKHYNESSASADLGVYLITEPDLSQEITKRHTVQEIYDFILSDLEYAIEHLSEEETPSKVKFNKTSALALRARVHFAMQNYDLAKIDAERALTANNALINFNDLDIVVTSYPGYGSWLTTDAPSVADNPETYATAYYGTVNWLGDKCTAELVTLFADNDIRKKQLLLQDDESYSFYNIAQITLAPTVPELLLIRAECNVRTGGEALTDALVDINYLRNNRYETGTEDLNIADFNQSQLLDLVLLERRKELCMKGHRWFDLKRLNLSENTQVTLIRTYKGEVRTLLPNGNNYVLPIPYTVMAYNPNIPNNPRD